MSKKEIEAAEVALAEVSKRLYKLRRQRVYSKLAKARKAHTVSKIMEARATCLENAEAEKRFDIAEDELDHLEILLGIEFD